MIQAGTRCDDYVGTMLPGISGALAGLHHHLRSLERTATVLSQAPPDDRLADALVHFIQDRRAVQVSAKVIRTANELIGSLLDELA